MGRDHCDPLLLVGYAPAPDVHGRNVGRAREVLALLCGRDDHAGSRGRVRVL